MARPHVWRAQRNRTCVVSEEKQISFWAMNFFFDVFPNMFLKKMDFTHCDIITRRNCSTVDMPPWEKHRWDWIPLNWIPLKRAESHWNGLNPTETDWIPLKRTESHWKISVGFSLDLLQRKSWIPLKDWIPLKTFSGIQPFLLKQLRLNPTEKFQWDSANCP